MNGKNRAAVCLFILICVSGAGLFWSIISYLDESWRVYVLCVFALLFSIYLLYETRTLILFIRATRYRGSQKTATDCVSALVLLNENSVGIKSWDIRGKTGIIIGRGAVNPDIFVDLTDTEYFSLISDYHAAMNYTHKGWMLSDIGSKNGTALRRAKSDRKLLLAPCEPVPVCIGDTIYIAEETVLAVK